MAREREAHAQPRAAVDQNRGEDAAGNLISNSSKLSPRLSAVLDPAGDGRWSASASVARYVSALNTGVSDVSAGGNPATYQWPYQGPAINPNPAGSLASTPQAIRQLFDWFFANGGTNRPFSLVDIPGVSSTIGDSLRSPNVNEWAAGVARQFGGRGSVRADLSLNYAYQIPGSSRAELFFRGEVLNVFDRFQLCGCGGTVFGNGGATDLAKINRDVPTAANSTTLQPFSPFTTTPVEGVHWAKRTNFATQVDQFSWTTPRTFRFSVGARF